MTKDADHEGRSGAALESIVSPLPIDEFHQRYFGKKSVHIRGEPSRFARLFSWRAFNDVLNRSPSPHPTSRLYKESIGPVVVNDAREMIHAAQEGTTVILQNADQCDANLSALLNEFSDQTGVQTRINVYASYPDEQGFPLHYDTHDVFIIQAEGSKRWRIFPPTIEYPLFYQKHHGIHRPDESALYLDCVLTSGDVLYIPRGHWHEAVAHADASLHLTLAVFAQTGIDFLSWLVDELRDDVRFRASLPLVLKDATTGYEASSNESIQQLQRLQSALLETLQDAPRLLDAFRSHCVAMQTLRRPFSFPHHFIDDPLPTGSHISFARPTRPSRLVTSNDQESIELIGAGQGLIRFGYQAKSLLEYVFSKSCFTIEELLDRFLDSLAERDIRRVLTVLVREGWIYLESPGPSTP